MKITNFLFISFLADFAMYCIFGLCITADVSDWDKTTTLLFVVLTIAVDLIILDFVNRKSTAK
jgi:hypothetical protein